MSDLRAASEPGARPLSRASDTLRVDTDSVDERSFGARWLGLLVLLVSIPYYAIGLDSDTLTHGDEAYWISAGSKAVSLVRDGDLWSSDWQVGSTASVLDVNHPVETAANRNPKLGAFLIGLSVHWRDAPPPPRWKRDYAFGRDPAWNRQHGLLPSRATLLAGRLPVAALSVVAVLWFFSLLRTLLHPGWAFAGALLLATSPLVSLLCRRAMLDGPAYAFSIGSILFAIRACGAPDRWGPMLLTGLLACAAVSSKLNAAILLPILGLAFAVESWRRRSPMLLTRATVSGAVAAVLFVALNPTLYVAPFEAFVSMLRIGSEIGGLGAAFRSAALPDVSSRIVASYQLLLQENGVFGSRLWPAVDVVFLVLGAGVLGMWAPRRPAARVLLLWLSVALAAVCLWPPVRWDRYFLPAVAPIVAAQSVGLAVVATVLARRVFRLFPGRAAAVVPPG